MAKGSNMCITVKGTNMSWHKDLICVSWQRGLVYHGKGVCDMWQGNGPI